MFVKVSSLIARLIEFEINFIFALSIIFIPALFVIFDMSLYSNMESKCIYSRQEDHLKFYLF